MVRKLKTFKNHNIKKANRVEVDPISYDNMSIHPAQVILIRQLIEWSSLIRNIDNADDLEDGYAAYRVVRVIQEYSGTRREITPIHLYSFAKVNNNTAELVKKLFTIKKSFSIPVEHVLYHELYDCKIICEDRYTHMESTLGKFKEFLNSKKTREILDSK
ncbi:MAG: hypothetical protein ACRC92_20185 [Peptostreptococcaceae bacterium]